MARIRSKRWKSSSVTLRACPSSTTPRPAAAAADRSSGKLPTCQAPVPAESISISSRSPAWKTRSRMTPSAVGERQMLPRQTNNRFKAEILLAQLEHGEEGPRRHLDATYLLHALLALLLFGEQLFLARDVAAVAA